MHSLHCRNRSASYLLLTFLLILYVGCATKLAPPYDKSVVDHLNSANTDAMTLFASTSSGTQQSDYKNRSEKYSALIGKLDAVAILAGARPMPQNKIVQKVNAALSARNATPLADDSIVIPSVHAIHKISETIAKMRDTDQKQGVTATEVQAFKGQSSIYFDQAITYESFLQRTQGEE